MSLTALAAANAAAAAAAAAAAGKKAAQVQLQAELNNDEEWNKFVQRDGLLVIDVYSEWCGPCIGMVGNLKKIKVEIGGDNLHLAIARADTIECLKRFRNRSEPTWMFIAAGQLVNVVFGADAPRLARTIEAELKNEEEAARGLRQRPQRAPHELTPQEQELVAVTERAAEQRRAREQAAALAARRDRREARARRVDAHFADLCPALLLPHAQKHLRKISDALEPHGVVVADKCPLVVGRENARWLAVEEPELGTPPALAALAERPSLALLLKKLPDREGDVIALARRALFGDEEEEGAGEAGDAHAPAAEIRADGVPGVLVPADRHQRAAVLDILFPKMVCAVVEPPTVAEPPHVALMFGAWQRRAVLTTAALPHVAPKVLRYGFFAGIDVDHPQLLSKTVDEYELRPDKDYAETIVLMVAVGAAEPALADSDQVDGPPPELLELGPIHVSEDAVVGATECERFFPSGYDAPKPTPKPKEKKKKKKRHQTNEESAETSVEARVPPEGGDSADNDAGAEGEPDDTAEPDADADGDGADDAHADKATSPPPQTPH